MSHSFSSIWIHAIWATKNRQPLIHSHLEPKLYSFLSEQLAEPSCRSRIINGMNDHIHVLFHLNAQKNVAEVIKQLKGASAHWINQKDMIPEKFAWQTGYAAYSVSLSSLEIVYKYISNQKSHHQKLTFQEEYDGFLVKIRETGER